MTETTTDPAFDTPPVIETVLGVQFEPLKDLTSVHVGWFWKEYLDRNWNKFTETLALPDQFERFEPTPFAPPQIRIGPVKFPGRSQISNPGDGRMIQIQPSQFHYNWNRVRGEYPRYRKVLEEFERHFANFCRFVKQADLGEVVPNQWELTYIDSIPKGALWENPSDWHEVLPGLFSPLRHVGSVRLEAFGGVWQFEIPPQRGRLHVTVNLAALESDPTPVLLYQSTARGPIPKKGGLTLREGLNLGHQAAVDLFLGVTSEKAQKTWGRKS
jgi:uncharacterized protein (TIGR04255 family)